VLTAYDGHIPCLGKNKNTYSAVALLEMQNSLKPLTWASMRDLLYRKYKVAGKKVMILQKNSCFYARENNAPSLI
jgi:hypothetical protein